MRQVPANDDFLLKWRGDILEVALTLERPRRGRAALRTNLGNARVRRREIIAETERGEVPLARAWTDLPLEETVPGEFHGRFALDEVGVFSGKACFFPEGSNVPEWPEGGNFHIKVESATVRSNNSIYTVFPRQFGSFREIVRRLDVIMDRMGFRIIQTLPPFPVPTTYAVMGEYGCPFAATDFFSVDPAMAEFDEFTTPLDQFRELVDAVHSRQGLFFVDLPANHTGWASTLQTHHPDWFRREGDGRFHSPGAWGVKWADLVELDYSKPKLRAYMADVFLFWCRNGVDGFRCDAGYMIPKETWAYIVARVREEYPDTVFMLEGLGGDLRVTDALLAEANLDWAYSEIFQTYDRGQFEWYLPQAIARSEKYGTLVHFAETHDNDRLAKGGEAYARLRVQLAALLSWQGTWGIANGVEWYCREKIDVHGKNDLAWGAPDNMVELIAKLNRELSSNAAFRGRSHLEVVTRGEGNTLAVVREADAAAPCLVLANLDCGNGVRIEWDRKRFPYEGGRDLISGSSVDLRGVIDLAPGQVLCVQAEIPTDATAVEKTTELPETIFEWTYPRDVRREFVVPENELVRISAPCHFRVRIVDPATGMTIRNDRSISVNGGFAAVMVAPHYKGDGTACRRLAIELAVYAPGKAERTHSAFLVPPPEGKAMAKLTMSGEEARRHPEYRTVLSNGAGAAAQIRVGWGTIASRYDAFLAANPNPTCPSDRQVLWTRTRCWLQREGYTRELDAKCMTRFTADPAGRGASWAFRVPCGMGRTASFVFEMTLAVGANAARLKVRRVAGDADDVGDQVRLVFRPDVENRSFHANTKAYVVEKSFSTPLKFALKNCVMHEEGQWTYGVAHPEEAERGQDGAGDLFSPGWISADLKSSDECEIVGSDAAGPFRWGMDGVTDSGCAQVSDVLGESLGLYVVRRDELKTVIAGYPWFLDWGRDTFIFMRGMIAAGMIDDSLKILRAFAEFEDRGTLPNIIYGKTAGNRDTVDAQLWFIRCVQEVEAAGGRGIAELKVTCDSLVENYLKGTPNGIRVDAESGLVWSPPHFTWMDTNYPACTPRCGYPVEIQALWISVLRYLGRAELAEKALVSVRRYFKLADQPGYADLLEASNGESAAQARLDASVRPNQLLLITLGILEDETILKATGELVMPGGLRSLSSSSRFYKGRYTGDEDTSRKQAYHNGTAWGWVFPLYAEALAKCGKCSVGTAIGILNSCVDNLNSGTLCHLSEIADGDAPHAQKGCSAQAWSVSELLRVYRYLSSIA